MENKSIPKLIIEILSGENRLTINEIFEKSELPIERKEYLRLCVNRLSGAKSPQIAKDGKRAKEYLYSLKENIEIPIENIIIEKYTKEYIETDKDFPFNMLEQEKIKEIWSRKKNG